MVFSVLTYVGIMGAFGIVFLTSFKNAVKYSPGISSLRSKLGQNIAIACLNRVFVRAVCVTLKTATITPALLPISYFELSKYPCKLIIIFF